MSSSSTRSSLRTPLMQILPQLSTPIVLGAMANAAGGRLAGKVSKAGGLGFIGAGYYTPETLRKELQEAMQFVPGTSNRVNIGVGFLAWRLTQINKGKPPALGASDLDVDSPALTLIDEALRVKPLAIWLSFGDAEEMIGWSTVIRQREAALNGMGRARYGSELKLFINVGNEQEAKTAVEDCGADVVVVQGNEAGGHGLGSSPPLSAILPLLAQRIKSYTATNPSSVTPALLGAGGIMTGANIASVLALGADGVVLGTRLLMTPDAAYSDAQKAMLKGAGPDSTKRTMAFDEARGTTGWPEGVDGRGVINETVKDYESASGPASSDDVDMRRAAYKRAEQDGDTSRIVTWAGTGVGLVNTVQPTEDVIAEVTREAIEAIGRTNGLVQQ